MLQFAMSSSFRLSDSNFVLYAMRNYDNPNCLDEKEFFDDLKRIKYIKRLLNRYHISGELKERFILNHIIVFYNVFKLEGANKMLFYKIDPVLWPYLKTFLVYLNFMPEVINEIGEEPIYSSDIALDDDIIKILRDVKAHERK